MQLIIASMLGLAIQFVVSLLVWWLRLWWQFRLERQRGQLAVRVAGCLRQTGGRLRELRADGSAVDMTVGFDGDR